MRTRALGRVTARWGGRGAAGRGRGAGWPPSGGRGGWGGAGAPGAAAARGPAGRPGGGGGGRRMFLSAPPAPGAALKVRRRFVPARRPREGSRRGPGPGGLGSRGAEPPPGLCFRDWRCGRRAGPDPAGWWACLRGDTTAWPAPCGAPAHGGLGAPPRTSRAGKALASLRVRAAGAESSRAEPRWPRWGGRGAADNPARQRRVPWARKAGGGAFPGAPGRPGRGARPGAAPRVGDAERCFFPPGRCERLPGSASRAGRTGRDGTGSGRRRPAGGARAGLHLRFSGAAVAVGTGAFPVRPLSASQPRCEPRYFTRNVAGKARDLGRRLGRMWLDGRVNWALHGALGHGRGL